MHLYKCIIHIHVNEYGLSLSRELHVWPLNNMKVKISVHSKYCISFNYMLIRHYISGYEIKLVDNQLSYLLASNQICMHSYKFKLWLIWNGSLFSIWKTSKPLFLTLYWLMEAIIHIILVSIYKFVYFFFFFFLHLAIYR